MTVSTNRSVTAMRFVPSGEHGDPEEFDALLEVEVGDTSSERGIDLHIDPRTDEVVTCSLRPDEAWALARELARCAAAYEFDA